VRELEYLLEHLVVFVSQVGQQQVYAHFVFAVHFFLLQLYVVQLQQVHLLLFQVVLEWLIFQTRVYLVEQLVGDMLVQFTDAWNKLGHLNCTRLRNNGDHDLDYGGLDVLKLCIGVHQLEHQQNYRFQCVALPVVGFFYHCKHIGFKRFVVSTCLLFDEQNDVLNESLVVSIVFMSNDLLEQVHYLNEIRFEPNFDSLVVFEVFVDVDEFQFGVQDVECVDRVHTEQELLVVQYFSLFGDPIVKVVFILRSGVFVVNNEELQTDGLELTFLELADELPVVVDHFQGGWVAEEVEATQNVDELLAGAFLQVGFDEVAHKKLFVRVPEKHVDRHECQLLGDDVLVNQQLHRLQRECAYVISQKLDENQFPYRPVQICSVFLFEQCDHLGQFFVNYTFFFVFGFKGPYFLYEI